jgi:hypothetical protein
MATKDDNVEAARLHYQNRKNNRPKQTWDEDLRVWIKEDNK